MEKNITEFIAGLIGIFLILTIFLAWLIMKILTTIASWRSMKAFEKIADALSETVKAKEKEVIQVKPIEPNITVDINKDAQPESKV